MTGQTAIGDDFEAFFEQARTGFIIAGPDGRILRANGRVVEWLGVTLEALRVMRFNDLLAISGKVYYETHLAPLLRMQGFIEEIALDLMRPNGDRLPILMNALERRDSSGIPLSIHFTLFKAADRRHYEREMLAA